LSRVQADADVVRLDVKGLRILAVRDTGGASDALWFRLPPKTSELGCCLEVRLPSGATPGVTIDFETGPGAPAIQWLQAAQTAGGKHPLVFTQSQAICGRSLFPCQDSPMVKATFSLEVTCPKPLVAVGSGLRRGRVDDEARGVSTFTYAQDIPVMSYLVAVICGDLVERPIGPRSAVWVEPAMADAAQKELDGSPEQFLVAAEKIVGSPYLWGNYDVAVLPRSFGYGGMENPNVTFFSASLLAGDKSLMPTLAHEITHSWSGNLVTNAKWKDFWLNEGFTRYIERRILGSIYGKAFRGLVLAVGYNDLVKTVDLLTATGSASLTALEPDIVGIDPDLAFSRVPYEKGSLFLYFLEGVVGGEDAMSEWLQVYISDFKKKSIETKDFQEHFCSFFRKKQVDLQAVDWETWLHGFGVPSYDLLGNVDRSFLQGSRDLADRWLAAGGALLSRPEPVGVSSSDFDGWRAQQIMIFLDNLIGAGPCKLSPERLDRMDELYGLTPTRNVEVSFRWLVLCLKNRRRACLPAVDTFLGYHGRGAYVKPLYAALVDFDPDFARSCFDRHGHFYQTVVGAQIPPLLRPKSGEAQPDAKRAKAA